MKTKNLFLLPTLLFVLTRAFGEVLVGGGGGPVPQPEMDCIPQAQREAIEGGFCSRCSLCWACFPRAA